jgi:hypothetical protein
VLTGSFVKPTTPISFPMMTLLFFNAIIAPIAFLSLTAKIASGTSLH